MTNKEQKQKIQFDDSREKFLSGFEYILEEHKQVDKSKPKIKTKEQKDI